MDPAIVVGGYAVIGIVIGIDPVIAHLGPFALRWYSYRRIRRMKMCFNWKMLAGLGVVGAGVYLLARELALEALPLLLVLACPISMLLMMRGMQGASSGEGSHCTHEGQQTSQATGSLTREGRLAQLRAELQRVGEQQSALARQIEELQAAETPSPSRALEEAEQVARAAEGGR